VPEDFQVEAETPKSFLQRAASIISCSLSRSKPGSVKDIPITEEEKATNEIRDKQASTREAAITLLGLVLTIGIVGAAVFQTVIYLQVRTQSDDNNALKLGRPINLRAAKQAIKKYHQSGEYDSDLNHLTSQWTTYFTNLTAGTNDIVVFDIDDTVLSSWSEMMINDFAYIPKLFFDWINASKATAIPQTVNFFNFLRGKGFKLFFVTGRQEADRAPTERNLSQESITNYTRMIMRNSTNAGQTAAVFKAKVRQELVVVEKFHIVGTIGDQLSDMYGDYCGYRMKVPNFCYFIS